MKKHRRFLILYSLYLGLIILTLTIFDNPQNKDTGLTDESIAVCTETKSSKEYAEPTKCCVSNANFLDYPEDDL